MPKKNKYQQKHSERLFEPYVAAPLILNVLRMGLDSGNFVLPPVPDNAVIHLFTRLVFALLVVVALGSVETRLFVRQA